MVFVHGITCGCVGVTCNDATCCPSHKINVIRQVKHVLYSIRIVCGNVTSHGHVINSYSATYTHMCKACSATVSARDSSSSAE